MIFNVKHGIIVHPFEGALCITTVLSVYSGFKLLVHNPEVLDNAESGILSLPKYLIWAWVVIGFIGAIVTFIGLTMTTWDERGRTLEVSGLWLMGSMWLTTGVGSSLLDLWLWEEYIRFFSLAAACILRLIVLHDFHKIMRRRSEEVKIQ